MREEPIIGRGNLPVRQRDAARERDYRMRVVLHRSAVEENKRWNHYTAKYSVFVAMNEHGHVGQAVHVGHDREQLKD